MAKTKWLLRRLWLKTDSPAFRYFESRRAAWAADDLFASPGPRQLWGPASRQVPITVALNRGYDSLDFSIGR
jgi:pyrophosphate--fructose-6-phosphate 1-phosphotransferase